MDVALAVLALERQKSQAGRRQLAQEDPSRTDARKGQRVGGQKDLQRRQQVAARSVAPYHKNATRPHDPAPQQSRTRPPAPNPAQAAQALPLRSHPSLPLNSSFTPITRRGKDAILAANRLQHCPPPPGMIRSCPPAGIPFSARSDQQLRLAFSLAGGQNFLKEIGYALVCFHSWANLEGVPDGLRIPLHPEVARRYVASLNGAMAGKRIRQRLNSLRLWHIYYDVPWVVREEQVQVVLAAAKQLQPHPKLRRDPLLSDHLAAIFPLLDFTTSFDVAFWAATTCAHRACLRSGEFTTPSQPKFDPKRHPTAKDLKSVWSAGVFRGFLLHLPFDKVEKERGADVAITAIPGHNACPVMALSGHLVYNQPTADEHIFTFTSSRGRSAGQRMSLTKHLWLERLNELLKQAGLPPLDGHSIRIGGATQLLMNGVDPLTVKVLGRWKSDAFERYWRHVTVILAQAEAAKEVAAAPVVRDAQQAIDEIVPEFGR